MIRVLQVVNDMHRAGLETMLMNYYRNIDRDLIQFDFLTHRPYESDYDAEIVGLGGKIYHAPRLYPQNYLTYVKYMANFWDKHKEYKIIHSHIDTMSYLPLYTAKKADIPVRIAHSHNTSLDHDIKYPLKIFFKGKIKNVANINCACGEKAGKFLFNNQSFHIIPNAIASEQFLYDEKIRNTIRKELNLMNKFVIGHVGRFTNQKNHYFILNIFKNVLTKRPDSVLMLVGIGELLENIKDYSKKLGIDKHILFLGNRSDVNELYQAMDVFLMPSFYEGIPVVGIEAQYAGLPCYFSQEVPREVSFTKNTNFISLSEKEEKWARLIVEDSKDMSNRILVKKSDQYDINKAAVKLQEFYFELVGDEKGK